MTENAPGGQLRESAGLLAQYDLHREAILRFLRARTRDPAEAEDVVQELWLRLRKVRTGPVANARAYLFQMANNLVRDRERERLRRARRDQRWTQEAFVMAAGPAGDAEAVDPQRQPDDLLIDAEENQQLRQAVDALPEGARRAFCLHKIDGLSHAEVASRLGISRSGVEKHIALAMKHLRRTLLDCGAGTAASSPSTDSDAP